MTEASSATTITEPEAEAVARSNAIGRSRSSSSTGSGCCQVARDGTTRTVSVVGSRRVLELEQLTALLTDAFR